jgi:hypothetical protein
MKKSGDGEAKSGFRASKLSQRLAAMSAALVWIAGCSAGLSSTALAQAPTVTVGSVTSGAGTDLDLPVTFAAGATDVSTLQFDLTFPSTLSYVSVTTGSAAAAAGRVPGTLFQAARIVVFGPNQTPPVRFVVTILHIRGYDTWCLTLGHGNCCLDPEQRRPNKWFREQSR